MGEGIVVEAKGRAMNLSIISNVCIYSDHYYSWN